MYVCVYYISKNNATKMHNDRNRAQPLNRAFGSSASDHDNMHCLNHKCYMDEHKSVQCH